MKAGNLCVIVSSFIGLCCFLSGFFLTKRELDFKADSNIVHLFDVVLSKQDTKVGQYFTSDNALFDVNDDHFREGQPEIGINEKRVFMFIVDAMRLDFMVRHETNLSTSHNQFTNMHNLLQHNASQCMMFGFRADPPTVTSQRLKGLTSGTLPTFVDIGSNFNSSVLTEDNFIDQLKGRNRMRRNNTISEHSTGTSHNNCNDHNSDEFLVDNICDMPRSQTSQPPQAQQLAKLKILGDDTWLSLFPAQFDTAFVFDSFDTKDLDAVDNGIVRHLMKEMRTTSNIIGENNVSSDELSVDWNLFVAHFLGVDHIGHTLHAHHPLMAERLALMDSLLLQVVEALPAGALLLLFGDHGMTDQGEHGGATTEETDSGLFIYSKDPIFSVSERPATEQSVNTDSYNIGISENCSDMNAKPRRHNSGQDSLTTLYWDVVTQSLQPTSVYSTRTTPRIVSQIDLVPTLSVWLGLPIPYSSLGMVIPEMFLSDAIDDDIASGCAANNECLNACLHGSGAAADMLMETLFVNSMQVWRYMIRYFGSSPDKELSHWSSVFDDARHHTHTRTATDSSDDSAPVATIQRIREQLRLYAIQSSGSSSGSGSKLSHLRTLLVCAVDSHLSFLSAAVNGSLPSQSSSDDCDSSDNCSSSSSSSSSNSSSGKSAEVYRDYVLFLSEAQGFARQQWTEFNLPLMVLGIGILFLSLCALLYLVLWPMLQPLGAIPSIAARNSTKSAFASSLKQHLAALSLERVALFVFPLLAAVHALSAGSVWFVSEEPWVVCLLLQIGTLSLGSQVLFSRNIPRKVKTNSCGLLVPLIAIPIVVWSGSSLTIYAHGDAHKTALLVVLIVTAVVSHCLWHTLHTTLTLSTVRRGRYWSLSCTTHSVFTALGQTLLVVYWILKSELLPAQWVDRILYVVNQVVGGEGGESKYFVSILLLMLPRAIMTLTTADIVTSVAESVLTALSASDISRTTASGCNPRVDGGNGNTQLAVLLRVSHHLFLLVGLLSLTVSEYIMLCAMFMHVLLYVYLSQHLLPCAVMDSSVVIEYSDSDGSGDSGGSDSGGSGSSDKHSSSCIDEKALLYLANVSLYLATAGRFLFFATGHRMDFGKLQLSVGFTGCETFHFLYAGLCLAINTFGHDLLSTMAVTMAGLWWHQRLPTVLRHIPLKAMVTVSIAHRLLIVLSSCAAAAILRRHLMVWALFAPKVAFEATIWVVVGTLHILLILWLNCVYQV